MSWPCWSESWNVVEIDESTYLQQWSSVWCQLKGHCLYLSVFSDKQTLTFDIVKNCWSLLVFMYLLSFLCVSRILDASFVRHNPDNIQSLQIPIANFANLYHPFCQYGWYLDAGRSEDYHIQESIKPSENLRLISVISHKTKMVFGQRMVQWCSRMLKCF